MTFRALAFGKYNFGVAFRSRLHWQPQNLAVVDGGGNLVAHVRMDGAWIGSVDISQNKAWTARAFGLPTKDLAGYAQPGEQFLLGSTPATTAAS